MNFTFQILDGGQTFLVPVGRSEGTIGSDEGCTIRLTEPGIAPIHARFKPLRDGSLKLVDEGTGEPVKINGDEVLQWRLQVGDRIEIGAAVLVFGQRIERKATPADVVRESAERPAAPRRTAPVARRSASRSSGGRSRSSGSGLPILPIVGAVVALLVVVLLLSDSGPGRPLDYPLLAEDLARGNHARASERLEDWRRNWAKNDNERLAILAADEKRVAKLRGYVERFEAQVLEDPGLGLDKHRERLVVVTDGLQSNDPQAVAARAVMADLADLLDRARMERRALLQQNGGTDNAAVAQGDESTGSSGSSEQGSTPELDRLQPILSDVDAALEAEEFERAEAILVQAIESFEGADFARLAARLTAVRSASSGQARSLIAEIDSLVDRGDRSVLARMAPSIERRVAHLTLDSRIPALTDALARFEHAREMGEVLLSESRDSSSVARSGRRLVRRGAFHEAAALHGEFAADIESTDPAAAAEHRALAKEAETLGRLLDLAAASHDAVEVEDPDTLFRVPGAELITMLEPHERDGELLMAAAALAYRRGDGEAGDQLFRKAERKARVEESSVQEAIARARGEQLDPEAGYEWREDRYLSAREVRLEERVASLTKDLDSMLGKSPDRWDSRLEQLIGEDDDAVDVLVAALRRVAERRIEDLESDDFRHKLESLEATRRELDEKRAAALAVIFDTTRYQFPTKDPDATAEERQIHQEAQQEIDQLVAEVRRFLDQHEKELRVPDRVGEKLARVRWISETLAGFEEFVPSLEDRIEWAKRIPADQPLSVATVALDLSEVDARAWAVEVEAYNVTLESELTAAEIELVQRTNAYRKLLGRRPLAVDLRMMEAGRSHAEEMADLGYFSHYSPTPGRRTPGDRMQLAGYHQGVSENLAQHPSAESSIHGWQHSSGHHRNMLAEGHVEIGVGQTGRYWVQVFGVGRELEPLPRPGRR
ncbi:MAG: CAP domain-containing protein [Planctomycetota bacterium]